MRVRCGAALIAASACHFEHGQLTARDAASDDVSADGMVDANLVPGVIARWEFDETSGAVAADTSNVGAPLDLTIDQPGNVTWGGGALQLHSEVRLRSAGPATKIIDACRASGAVSVEAWVVPADNVQGGPARVLSISADAYFRDVTLGQEGATWILRLRTSNTDLNGLPTLATTAAIAQTPVLAHLVLTEDATDRVLYVDGVERARDALAGGLAGWDAAYPVLAANEELGTTRTWLGTIYRIVVYDRQLSPTEVATLHAQGP